MENLVEQVNELLVTIQQRLFDVAKQKRDACTQTVRTWDEFIEALGQRKLILAPWCDEEVCVPCILCNSVCELHVGFHLIVLFLCLPSIRMFVSLLFDSTFCFFYCDVDKMDQ